MFETTVHKYRKIRKNSMEKIETDWRNGHYLVKDNVL